MNAFKRRKNIKDSTSSDNLSIDMTKETPKPTFESIVQRVMRMRISGGITAEDEPPPDLPIKGAKMAKSSSSNVSHPSSHQPRSRSNGRKVVSYFYYTRTAHQIYPLKRYTKSMKLKVHSAYLVFR